MMGKQVYKFLENIDMLLFLKFILDAKWMVLHIMNSIVYKN